VYGFPFLQSIISYLVAHTPVGSIDIKVFTLSRFFETAIPSIWLTIKPSIFKTLLFTYINNSVYLTYGLIILGTFAAYKYNINNRWLALNLSLIALSFLYFSVLANFRTVYSTRIVERYRFFYYLNFLAFPLMGVGIYWLFNHIARFKLVIVCTIRERIRVIQLKSVHFLIVAFVLSFILTSSIYAGYPREDSMGPYNYKRPAFPSDYDVQALEFIHTKEAERRDFFIVGDTFTCAAGLLNLGYRTIPYDFHDVFSYVPIFSFFESTHTWGENKLFSLAVSQPIKYIVDGVNYTNAIANNTYIILTSRLGEQKLNQLFSEYRFYLGNPIYTIENKIYVFQYDKNYR
ncbi:MAG: hypothetical protein ACFE8U_14785, partial [Candidatus Hermodarchaeota archaeon]